MNSFYGVYAPKNGDHPSRIKIISWWVWERHQGTVYIPNQDQNVIQHTALIFLGRWSVVLSIIESMASAPDFFRRALITVSSANLCPSI